MAGGDEIKIPIGSGKRKIRKTIVHCGRFQSFLKNEMIIFSILQRIFNQHLTEIIDDLKGLDIGQAVNDRALSMAISSESSPFANLSISS